MLAIVMRHFPSVSPKNLLFLPLLTILVILLIAACGSSSSGSSSISPASSQPTMSDQAALELLKRSAEVGDNIQSSRMHIDMDGQALGEDFSMSMDVDLARNGWMRSKIEVIGTDFKGAFEQVIAAPDVYIKFDGGVGWLRMDIEDLAAQAGVSVESLTDPTSFAGTLFPGDDIPWDLYSVRSLGTERVDGIRTEHLRVDVDFAQVWERLSPKARQELSQALDPTQELLGPNTDQSIQYENVEVWIDDRYLAVRMAIEVSMGSNMKIGMDMWMRDYNADIQVKAPDAYTDLP